jgi:hypothetical protein
MAFQDVRSQGKARKATDLAVGESIIGYVVRTEESREHEGRFNLIMQAEDSTEQYLLFTAGTLNYDIVDQRIKTGLLTKITRLADKQGKRNKMTAFQVQQDPEKTLEDASFNAIGIDKEPSNERQSVKAQAAKMAAGMKRA